MLTLLNPISVWLMFFGWMVLLNPITAGILMLVAFFSGWWPNFDLCVKLNKYSFAFDVIDSVWLVCICLCVLLQIIVWLGGCAFVFLCLLWCGCVLLGFGLLVCWFVFFVLIVVLLYYFDPLIFFGLPLLVVLTPLGYSFHCHIEWKS